MGYSLQEFPLSSTEIHRHCTVQASQEAHCAKEECLLQHLIVSNNRHQINPFTNMIKYVSKIDLEDELMVI